MAISINWGTKVITVPKDDLILTQVSPEVRELNLDWFRLELKNLEDDPDDVVDARTDDLPHGIAS